VVATTSHPRDPIDLLDGELYRHDPYPVYAWLRDESPVHRDVNGIWGLARYDDVVAASKHPELFSSAQSSRPNSGPNPYMIDQDDPRHARQRRLVYKGFTPRQVAQLEDHTREIVTRILDEVVPRGRCDFTQEVAAPLPMTLIGEMLGIAPEDYEHLQHWSDEMIRGSDGKATDDTIAAYMRYREYESAVIGARRATPADDLASILVHAEIDGERLDEEEVLAELLLLLVGGNETTRNVISGAMEALIAHPDQRQLLIDDPTLIPDAVEEFIRWVTPILNMRRTTTQDVEVRGQVLREGDQVLLMYGSANRDEAVFDQPDRFDVRRHPNPHVSFGFGSHFCLGASLARLEIRLMYEEVLPRLRDIRLAGEVQRAPSSFIRGIVSMPVEFTAAAPSRHGT
jgi:cytochrome P450 family 142 subfamily A polypeptide 1